MTKNTEKKSPAEEYFHSQLSRRTQNRVKFKKDESAQTLHFVHEVLVSMIAKMLKRIGGKRWPDDLDKEVAIKCTKVANLQQLFMHGVELCEVTILEGLYGQAAALMRQQMEIIAAIKAVWDGTDGKQKNKKTKGKKRGKPRTPNINLLPAHIKQHYGALSELTHAAVPEQLHFLFNVTNDDVGAASTLPVYKQNLARVLLVLEINLLFELIGSFEVALNEMYGKGFDDEELKLQKVAFSALQECLAAIYPND